MRRSRPPDRRVLRTLRRSEAIPDSKPRRYLTGDGYIRLRWRLPDGTYVEDYEHRVVTGRPYGLHVHHINGDKADNRPENLAPMPLREHALLHGDEERHPGRRRQPGPARPRTYPPFKGQAAMLKAAYAEYNRRERLAKAFQMADLYRQGLTTIEIGQRIGLDSSGVSRVLRQIGVLMRPRSNIAADAVTDRTRQIVKARACLSCERCGRSVKWAPGHVHHRQPRGMGGSSRPEAHAPANLLLLCVECHVWVESNRAAAIEDGWLVPMGMDPAQVPVWIVGRGQILLNREGGYG